MKWAHNPVDSHLFISQWRMSSHFEMAAHDVKQSQRSLLSIHCKDAYCTNGRPYQAILCVYFNYDKYQILQTKTKNKLTKTHFFLSISLFLFLSLWTFCQSFTFNLFHSVFSIISYTFCFFFHFFFHMLAQKNIKI